MNSVRVGRDCRGPQSDTGCIDLKNGRCAIAVPAMARELIAAGFSGHGFAIEPGAGRLVSEIALNETPMTDISRV